MGRQIPSRCVAFGIREPHYVEAGSPYHMKDEEQFIKGPQASSQQLRISFLGNFAECCSERGKGGLQQHVAEYALDSQSKRYNWDTCASYRRSVKQRRQPSVHRAAPAGTRRAPKRHQTTRFQNKRCTARAISKNCENQEAPHAKCRKFV